MAEGGLGGNQDLVATVFDSRAENLLGLAAGVDIRRVEQI